MKFPFLKKVSPPPSTPKEEENFQQLSEELDRLRAILQGMKEGVAVTDGQGTITLANPSFYQIFHLDFRCEGKTILESLLNKETHEILQECLQSHQSMEKEIVFRVGTDEKNIMVYLTPLGDGGSEDLGAILVFFDLTTIRRLERVRKDFVANVSHELKTPLTSIRGFAETLINSDLKDPKVTRRFLEKVEKNAILLENLIEDILRISEIESGRKEWNPKTVHLPEILHEVQSLFSEALEKKGIQWEGKCPSNCLVSSEPAALKQILVNLIDNAIKYNRPRGLVRVDVSEKKDWVEITISDKGLGIAPKDLPHIFERFYRVDEARSRDLGGTGLGLAIVKHLVQAHGGQVWVDSLEAQGSRFSFTLPRAKNPGP